VEISGLLGVAPGVTAVIGGGGKTTLLRTLGEELARGGAAVVLCATAKFYPFAGLPNLQDPSAPELAAALKKDRLVCAGREVPGTGGKLTAPGLPMEALAALADYVLVEADGSARRPLKAHAPHEPVIPPEAGRVICVVGLAGLGRPIAEAAHRPERYAALAGASLQDPVTPERAAAVLNGEALGDLYYVNQADTAEQRAQARALAALLQRPAAVGSLQKGVYEPCW
jgi:probable selenium-dependent hydroxylase accessory protein YqeC